MPLGCSRVLISMLFGFLDIVSCWPNSGSLVRKLPWSHTEWNLHRIVVTLSGHLCFVYKHLLVLLSMRKIGQPHMVKFPGTSDIVLKVINSTSLLNLWDVNQSDMFLFLYHSKYAHDFSALPSISTAPHLTDRTWRKHQLWELVGLYSSSVARHSHYLRQFPTALQINYDY